MGDRVQSLGLEDLLKNGMATHSSILSPPPKKGLKEIFRLDSLVAQLVKNLPAMQDTQVQSLSWENPLEKEMATHPSIHAWRIP